MAKKKQDQKPRAKAGRPPIGPSVHVRIPQDLLDRMSVVEKTLGLDHSSLIRRLLTEQLHTLEQVARIIKANKAQEE